MPTSTNTAVTRIEVRNRGSWKRVRYCSNHTTFTANGLWMSREVKSVNDIANDPMIGKSMNTAKTATKGSAKPHAMRA